MGKFLEKYWKKLTDVFDKYVNESPQSFLTEIWTKHPQVLWKIFLKNWFIEVLMKNLKIKILRSLESTGPVKKIHRKNNPKKSLRSLAKYFNGNPQLFKVLWKTSLKKSLRSLDKYLKIKIQISLENNI